MENYIQIRVLGKGSFGSAWLVQRRCDNAQFVAKEVRLSGMKPAERESAKREIDVLRTLNHPNITRYVDHFEQRGSLYIVMEYANGGDLYTKIKQRKGARFTEKEILHFFSQLCLALLHLHERHILHRDLKTQNVFLTTDGVVKLGDFGISTVLRNTFELKRTVCGTPYYFSPELCLNKPYNNKSDVWALGCILYELTTLTHAFDGVNMKCLVQKILKGVYPPIHSGYSVNLSKLISVMLQIDPGLRPNVGQIIALPYMREFLSTLQRAVEVAQCDKRACNPSEKKEQAGSPQRDMAARAEERRREEQVRAMRLARERQDLRLQVELRQRENEERLQKLQAQQQEAEIERENKRKELEARVREQRRLAERRAKAQALIHKQREEEWERNQRENAEEYKRRQREAERLAQERAEQNAPRERVSDDKNVNNDIERPEKRTPSAAAAVELYREMRRQAALNKQRMIEEMGAVPERPQPSAAPVLEPRKQTPPNPLPPPNGRQKRINSLGKMAPEEAEEVRRQIFWQMRRETLENKRRALGLDAEEGESAQRRVPLPLQPQPQQQQQQQDEQQQLAASSSRPPTPPQALREKKRLQGPREGKAKEGNPVVYAKRVGLNGVSRLVQPLLHAGKDASATPDGGAAVPDGDNGEAQRRDEDYSALHTVIDAALTKGDESADVKDFNDEAFPENNPAKFMLDGQTLVLPNVQATDPLMHRIESLRLFLEVKLGETALIGAYRQMNNISADDDEAIQRVADALPEEHQKYIPVIAQLIVCEDAFNRQLLQ